MYAKVYHNMMSSRLISERGSAELYVSYNRFLGVKIPLNACLIKITPIFFQHWLLFCEVVIHCNNTL